MGQTAKAIFLLWLCGVGRLMAIPDVSFEVCTFQTEKGAMVEVALYFTGESLTCAAPAETYGATYFIFIQDTAGLVVAGDHYRQSGSGCPARDLVDLRRFLLHPGQYTVMLEAADIHDTLAVLRQGKTIVIPDDMGAWTLSDIQLLAAARPDTVTGSNMVKSGLYMEPLPFQYYYPALQRLYAYVETYHTDGFSDQPFIRYSLAPMNGDSPSPVIAYKKIGKTAVQAHLLQLDISPLISGTYRFEVVLFDGKDREVASNQAVVFRYNPRGDSTYIANAGTLVEESFVKALPEDSLDFFLRAHVPVVSSMDVDVINELVRKGTPASKRFFIHRYWTSSSGRAAEQGFQSYMRVARYADALFNNGFGFGFESDRGHTFLKYGRPDDIIVVEDEPSAPPYEIWIYNDFPVTHQSNVRFLFYNPTMIKNGHILLHSTAIGSVSNPRWEIELYKDATLETPGVNERVMGDNVHRNARLYFEN